MLNVPGNQTAFTGPPFLRYIWLTIALITPVGLRAIEPFNDPDAVIQETQDEKLAYLKSIGPIKDHAAVRFVGIKMNQHTISVRTILRQPKEEIFNEGPLGKIVECTWESETGKSLYVRFANDKVRYISLRGYTQDEIERFREINLSLENFAKKSTEAIRYKHLLSRNKWTYSERPFEGTLAGWQEGQPLFRVSAKNMNRILSKEIKLFPKKEQHEILFYRDYNFQRAGEKKSDVETFELRPKKP